MDFAAAESAASKTFAAGTAIVNGRVANINSDKTLRQVASRGKPAGLETAL
jgi:hypothetical protein